MKNRIIVGITGASGVIYGLTLLEALVKIATVEIHLVISTTAKEIFNDEINADAFIKAKSMAHFYHDINNLAATIASGSFKTEGMIIAPCSAKTLAAIAHGYGDNLISRAADVVLKERRKLVVLFRETPLHLGHIENMAMVTRMGGILLPPIPAFYYNPQSVTHIVEHAVGKALEIFNMPQNLYKSWEGKAAITS
jgi:4-hydroxy-3-polyprenylbenzoate decarboxylase